MAFKTANKNAGLRRAAAVVLTIILIALALLAFLFRDELSREGLRGLFGLKNGSETAAGEAFSFETGSDQVFALAGSGLAVASSTGLQLLDEDGVIVAKQIFSLGTPAIAASPVLCAFYDVGGKDLRVAAPDGECRTMDTENAILSVTLNPSGYMAVSTEQPGYKGLVQVYNPSSAKLYAWYSGSGYLLMARVSPDGRGLVASCAEESGGVLHFFSLDSEAEKASWLAGDEIILEIAYLSDGTLAVVTESRLVFLDGSGGETAAYDFGGRYLKDYQIEGDYATVLLSQYRSGTGGVMLNISSSGAVLGQREVQRDPLSLSASGGQLLALYSDGLALYSQDLQELYINNEVLGRKKALLRTSGDALLLSGYDAQVLRLG
jgi:hypothetical protein